MRLPITPHLPKRSRHFSYVSGESGIWTQEPRSPGLQFSRLPPNLRNAVSGIRTHMFSRLFLGQVCIPVPPWRPKAWTEGVEPSRRTISPAGFRDQCCTSWARSTDTDDRTWTGMDCSSWVWANRVCHFATSAFYCTSRESNSAGMLRITMSKQRIVFMDTISARHCIHPIASYAFPISPSCSDPIGDRTRVYAVRWRCLTARLWDRGVTTGNRTPMSRSTICRSAVELWPQWLQQKYIFIYKIEFLIKCLRIQYLSHFFILYIKTITYAKYAKKNK